MLKKLEARYKKIRIGPTASCVPTHQYADRFFDFMKSVFNYRDFNFDDWLVEHMSLKIHGESDWNFLETNSEPKSKEDES